MTPARQIGTARTTEQAASPANAASRFPLSSALLSPKGTLTLVYIAFLVVQLNMWNLPELLIAVRDAQSDPSGKNRAREEFLVKETFWMFIFTSIGAIAIAFESLLSPLRTSSRFTLVACFAIGTSCLAIMGGTESLGHPVMSPLAVTQSIFSFLLPLLILTAPRTWNDGAPWLVSPRRPSLVYLLLLAALLLLPGDVSTH